MNGEQRAKIHSLLDSGRSIVLNAIESVNAETVKNIANTINRSLDRLGNISLISGPLGSGVLIKLGTDLLKTAINSTQSWLIAQLESVKKNIKDFVWSFTEDLKINYQTGGEINANIEAKAQQLKNQVDRELANFNINLQQTKGKFLQSLGSLRNLGFGNFNLYDQVAAPIANTIAGQVSQLGQSHANYSKEQINYEKLTQQRDIANFTSTFLADPTGLFFNKIHKVEEQLQEIEEQIRQQKEKARLEAEEKARLEAEEKVRQIEALLNDPEERKSVLDALFRRGYRTAEEALNFVKEKLPEVRQQIQQELVKAAEEARKLAEKTIRNMVNSLLPPGGTDTKTSVSVKDGIRIAGKFGIGGVGVKKAGDKILERDNKNGQVTYYVSQEMLVGITGQVGPDQGLKFDLPGMKADIKKKGEATVTGEVNFALGVKYQFNPETPGDMFKLATLLFSDYIVEGILPPQQGLVVNDMVNRLLVQNLHSVKPAVGLEVQGKVNIPTFQAAFKAGIKGSVTREQKPPKDEWSLEASLAGNVELGSILGWTAGGEGKITASVKKDAISNHIDEVAIKITFAGANSLSDLGLLLDKYSPKQLSTAIIRAAETEIERASLFNKKMQGYKVKFTLTNPGETFAPLSSIIKQLEIGEQPNFSMIRDLVNTISSFNENKEVDVWAIESDELALKIEGTVAAVGAEIGASVTFATERQIG